GNHGRVADRNGITENQHIRQGRVDFPYPLGFMLYFNFTAHIFIPVVLLIVIHFTFSRTTGKPVSHDSRAANPTAKLNRPSAAPVRGRFPLRQQATNSLRIRLSAPPCPELSTFSFRSVTTGSPLNLGV